MLKPAIVADAPAFLHLMNLDSAVTQVNEESISVSVIDNY